MRAVIVSLLLLAVAAVARADRDERVPAVTDPVVKKECGACHMVFPPQFLPKRSWQKLVANLSDHFGENAALGDVARRAVLDYHLANAADSPRAGREGGKFARSVAAGQTPLRITETGRWAAKHREVRADRWTNPEVKSRANCAACHKNAAAGDFETLGGPAAPRKKR